MTTPLLPLRDETLGIEAWNDPVVETVGHDPRSPYVERFWLGILGPSTVCFLRRMADGLDDHPDGFTISLPDTARALGLGIRPGKYPGLLNAIERACAFGFARFDGAGTLAIRRRVPALNTRQTQRLTRAMRLDHDRWLDRTALDSTDAKLRRRAFGLALSLLDLGEAYDDTERQLHQWNFHPALAHEAMRWATSESKLRRSSPGTGSDPTGIDRQQARTAARRAGSPDMSLAGTIVGPAGGGTRPSRRAAVLVPATPAAAALASQGARCNGDQGPTRGVGDEQDDIGARPVPPAA